MTEPSATATAWPVWVNTVTVSHPFLAGTTTSPCSTPMNGPTRGTVVAVAGVVVSAGMVSGVGVIVTVAVTTGSGASVGGVTGAAEAAATPTPPVAVSTNAVARIMGWEMRLRGPPGPDDCPSLGRWGLVGVTVPPYRAV
ncbi:hypothetical protein F5972_31745 [Microbispora cellulosiformans]|uniref:Uncharacterized protein n=1 Tax=Microbispora cellulosiformans TaxID=2614688 RepID=A0A5J5JTL8_9ACTN|nr:hypothetical protein F5972_31745 [Microbispora cellulosiformans]